MTEQFFTYSEQFVSFSQEERDLLAATLIFRKVDTKTELVSYDTRSDELFFLMKGCIRKYYLKNGEQITIYITTGNSFIGAFESFINGTKSNQIVECLEPCDVLVLKKKDLAMLYEKVPQMNEFIRKMLQEALIQFQQVLTSFILDSPEERYIKLLTHNPEILQRVPQHMLATYLGITATSLSRIRKRILKKT